MYSANQIIRGLSPIVALAFITLSPTARAVDPPPDGGYPNQNTAEGEDALFVLDQGVANTAIGFEALFSNTEGHYNTGVGAFALQFNTTGIENTAIGYGALPYNITGQYNTASGRSALYANTTGSNNTAGGYSALYYNTTGDFNTAIGVRALARNTIGSNNIAIGPEAGLNLDRGSDNIYIGDLGLPRDSNVIRIGRVGTQRQTFIAGISGATVAEGVTVIVDTNGQLGTIVSSKRFKNAIKPMDKASEAILALQPVTFRYKKELDPKGIPQFGLVAEQVANVDPDLVARDREGKPYTVRYEAVNAMLLNEFLKEHRKVESLEKAIAEQQKDSAAMRAVLKEQAAQIQKVNHKLEAQQPAPRVVADNQ
jgi:hypothetical protein